MKKYIASLALVLFSTFSFSQTAQPCPDEPVFTDPRDGRTYQTVQIGNQCWMKENLAWLPGVFPPSDESSTDPRYYIYWFFGSDVSEAMEDDNYLNYGVLYNWPAAQAACPPGWQLPSDDEWQALVKFLGGTAVAGGKMKSRRMDPDPHPRWIWPNEGATNESGFSALPAGFFYDNGHFGSRGSKTSFWSATLSLSGSVWSQTLYSDASMIFRHAFAAQDGFSVRCMRD